MTSLSQSMLMTVAGTARRVHVDSATCMDLAISARPVIMTTNSQLTVMELFPAVNKLVFSQLAGAPLYTPLQ